MARDYGQMTVDLINQVKGFELYPEGKGEPVKGFKGESGTLCLKFKKMPLAAACRFGRRRDQGGGWNKTPGESRRGLNGGRWAQGDPSSVVWRTGGGWILLLMYRSVSPGLLDLMILRFSDSVFSTPQFFIQNAH